MKIVFYDKSELVLPEVDEVENMIDSNFDVIFHYMAKDSVTVGTSLINYLNSDFALDAGKQMTQQIYKNAVDYCVNIDPSDKSFQDLTLYQRLYRYQKAPIIARIEAISTGLTIRYEVVNPSTEPALIELVESEDVYSIYYLELIKMISNNVYVKKCEYCRRYFLIDGRRKTVKYCDKIPEGKTQPCFALAAREKYEQSLEKDPAVMAYRRAYKKFNARVRIGKWDKSDFFKWSTSAKESLEKYQDGSITEEEFKKWLKEGI